MILSDQAYRDRFIKGIDRNFSVLAPAGVGKTRAIVDRVVTIATNPEHGREYLQQLAVVTYTNKAADEMQQRARASLLTHPNGAALMGDFNRAFFGTIHSFCLNLLRSYGHYLGLPASLEMANDQEEDELWVEFFRQFTLDRLDTGLTPAQLATCFRHLRVQNIVELARQIPPGTPVPKPGACPDPDFQAILGFVPDKRNAKTVPPLQDHLRQWKAAYESKADFLLLPEIDKGGKDFQRTWNLAFAPLRTWLSHGAAAIAAAVSEDYRQYRIRAGRLTYADQIAFVLELLEQKAAGRQMRTQGYRIILDEAQDTDPNQFRVLLELARPADAQGIWADKDGVPPQPGRFCMVGDPQQSIYGKRADLGFYQDVRAKLREAGGEELEFHVTFRCAAGVIDAANALCPAMLNGEDGQVSYVELKPKPEPLLGQVVRFQVSVRPLAARPPDRTEHEKPTPPFRHPSKEGNQESQIPSLEGSAKRGAGRFLKQGVSTTNAEGRPGIDELARMEAEQIAAWIKEQGLAKLGARGWSEVAILCPRKRWIDPIELALQEHGLPVQNHSLRSLRVDDPAFAWFAALLVCMGDPCNSFELAGVLREIVGIPDTELYEFTRAGGVFQIKADVAGKGAAADALNQLRSLRQELLSLPVLDAARRMIVGTRLADRLAAISADGGAAAMATLDALISQAARAEAEGLSLADWAEAVRRQANDEADPPPVRADAIQLISCHGAKGLEWDTVILPFMGRPIRTAGTTYPFVHKNQRDRESTMVFGKEWLEPDDHDRIKQSTMQEHQRLLYVAMTRARNTLVFFDDRLLFGQAKESFAACLGVTESQTPAAWSALPSMPLAPAARPAAKAAIPVIDAVLEPVTEAIAEAAAGKAAQFPVRILPYSLARHNFDAEPELNRSRDPEWEYATGETAKRYGTWWHGVMERLDWKDRKSWQAVFDEALPFCPIPDRAKREWALFLESDIARRLASPSLRVQVEVPFLRARPDGRCVEGFIDLVAFDAERSEWLVLDWKTNEIAPDALKELWEIYEPQVAEYVQTVRLSAGPKATIRSCLYSSHCGQTVAE